MFQHKHIKIYIHIKIFTHFWNWLLQTARHLKVRKQLTWVTLKLRHSKVYWNVTVMHLNLFLLSESLAPKQESIGLLESVRSKNFGKVSGETLMIEFTFCKIGDWTSAALRKVNSWCVFLGVLYFSWARTSRVSVRLSVCSTFWPNYRSICLHTVYNSYSALGECFKTKNFLICTYHFQPCLKIGSESKSDQKWILIKYYCVISCRKAHGKEIPKSWIKLDRPTNSHHAQRSVLSPKMAK